MHTLTEELQISITWLVSSIISINGIVRRGRAG